MIKNFRAKNIEHAKQSGHNTPRNDPVAAAMCAGWNDFMADQLARPRKEVEAVDRATQRNYELGRAIAATAYSRGQRGSWHPDYSYVDLRANGLISDAVHAAIMEEHAFQLKDELK